jgi:2-aminoadipate transaminase
MELADHYGFYIVEDDAYSELAAGPHENALAAYDSSRKLIHIGSFSKTVAPGIRLGWMASHTGIAQRIGSWLPNAANPYLSAVVRQMLASRALDKQIAACRQALGIRRQVAVELLQEVCPNISFLQPEGGFFVFCGLPLGVSEERLVAKCREAGVLIMPGQGFVRGETCSRGYVRICYARVSTAEIERGIMILGRQLEALEWEAAHAS